MTFFWIFFVLGFTYLTALVGDIYRAINPWRAICAWIERARPGTFRSRLSYPTWLGYYPALVFYMAFIWLELFSHASPRGIGLVLLAYSAINLGGAAVFGREPWFKYAELFGVLFRLIGKIAPFEYVAKPGQPVRIRLRQPFVGLLMEPADHFSLLLLVLFMLSSTAFDGVHETLPWVQMFWKYFYPVLAWAFSQPYSFFVTLYYGWQWIMLWLSPFVENATSVHDENGHGVTAYHGYWPIKGRAVDPRLGSMDCSAQTVGQFGVALVHTDGEFERERHTRIDLRRHRRELQSALARGIETRQRSPNDFKV